jgi:putative membrane protein
MFIRINIVNRKKWIPFLVVSVCLAISAFYELVEWWMAFISGNAANDFIGSQGRLGYAGGHALCAYRGRLRPPAPFLFP